MVGCGWRCVRRFGVVLVVTGNQTVTVVRGRVDTRTGSWVEASRFAVAGCLVDPTSTAEQTGAGDVVEVNATVYAPFGADFRPADRVLFAGATYDVVGAKADWVSPFTGQPLGTVARLILRTG